MLRRILPYAAAAAVLIVAVRLVEVASFAGALPMKAYVAIIGLLFLAIGLGVGLRLTRRSAPASVEGPARGPEMPDAIIPAPTAPDGPQIAAELAAAEPAEAAPPAGPRATPQAREVLSARELEVLLLLAEGHTNREIGERLFVSENTVKTHVNNIYAKLDVRRRTQAVARAKELGLIA